LVLSASQHDWHAKLAEGIVGEDAVIQSLSRLGVVTKATSMELQRLGIDCFVENPLLGIISVEIKTDSQISKTGNAFLEYSIEYERENRLGWILKTVAQRVAYYSPQQKKVYLLDAVLLKKYLPHWKREHPIGNAISVNEGRRWIGVGVLVPFTVLYSEVGTGILDVAPALQV